MREPKTAVISVRISADVKAKMERCCIGPYPVTLSAVIERGIVLALEEMARVGATIPQEKP
jgi:hypothetical protein